MIDQTQVNSGFIPFGAGPSGVLPQGFDFGQFAQQIAGQAAQALPGLIMGLLAAHPVVGQQVRAQSAAPQAAAPQGFSPQGFDFGQFAQQIAGRAAQALPGLIMGLLAAHPVVGQQVRAQSAAPQAAAPQGFSPQGFDFGQFAQQIAGQAAQALPGLIMGLLSANPMVGQQLRAQSVAPQGAAPPGFAPQGFAPQGFAPQGFDFGQFAQQIAGQVATTLPSVIMNILSSRPMVGSAAGSQTTH
jgi:uncharacterized membrane protein